jgi:hypothetical protein
MPTETVATEQTWRCLWSHAAYDIISSLPSTTHCDRIQVGAGWGFRSRSNHQRALLVHPSGNGRDAGDLALTVLGQGTQIIPRCSYSYPEYLDEVADIIETTARVYLEIDTTDRID